MKAILLIAVGCILSVQTIGASPPPSCHEITVVYEGREFVYSIDGLDFYRWHYTLVADSCINRALSFWILDICPDWLPYITDVSTVSADNSDPTDGDATLYKYEIGVDPHSGLVGLKWEHVAGNELDRIGEYDRFSFVSPGLQEPTSTVVWVSKGGQLYDGGVSVRPGCIVVQTEATSWGRLKTKYR